MEYFPFEFFVQVRAATMASPRPVFIS